jgi:hypothetical protein
MHGKGGTSVAACIRTLFEDRTLLESRRHAATSMGRFSEHLQDLAKLRNVAATNASCYGLVHSGVGAHHDVMYSSQPCCNGSSLKLNID